MAILLLAVAPWFWAVGKHPIVSLEGESAAWSGWLLLAIWVLWPASGSSERSLPWSRLPLLAIGVLALAVFADLITGRVPYIAPLLIVMGYLLVGAMVFMAGVRLTEDKGHALTLVQCVASLWLLAGLFCVAIAGWQFLRPQGYWPWIAPLNDVGRVFANLRQPNHLATMLAMSWVCLIWLSLERKRIRPCLMLAAGTVLMAGMSMTGSRTGFIILLVCAVAMVWHSRSRHQTLWLMGFFLAMYAFVWVLLIAIDGSELYGSFGADRLRQLPDVKDVSGSRFGVWRSTLDIIMAHPLIGVGTGRFAYAYILGEWSQPATLQFTHAHNLFLHLAAEHGVPVMLLMTGSVGYFLFKCWRSRCEQTWWWAWVFPLPVLVHSMFELPLWYTYFLFPTLFSWGLIAGICQSVSRDRFEVLSTPSKQYTLVIRLALCVLLLAPLAIWRAQQETHELYVVQEKPFFERLQVAQTAFWLRQYADHALLNSAPLELVLDEKAAVLFPAVGQVLLDAKLLRSWAMNCAAQGDIEKSMRLAYAAKLISQPDFDRWRALVLTLDEPRLAALQVYLRQPGPIRLWDHEVDWRSPCQLSDR